MSGLVKQAVTVLHLHLSCLLVRCCNPAPQTAMQSAGSVLMRAMLLRALTSLQLGWLARLSLPLSRCAMLVMTAVHLWHAAAFLVQLIPAAWAFGFSIYGSTVLLCVASAWVALFRRQELEWGCSEAYSLRATGGPF